MKLRLAGTVDDRCIDDFEIVGRCHGIILRTGSIAALQKLNYSAPRPVILACWVCPVLSEGSSY
jgi:hypothetical protein